LLLLDRHYTLVGRSHWPHEHHAGPLTERTKEIGLIKAIGGKEEISVTSSYTNRSSLVYWAPDSAFSSHRLGNVVGINYYPPVL